MAGVTLSFNGVNEIYQLAMAAQESGNLDAFYCSLLDTPGKWGARLASLLGSDVLINRRVRGLDAARTHEFPWPFLLQRLAKKAGCTQGRFHWTKFNFWFDAWVSRQLASSSSRIFVGTETCARDSFRVAKRMGMQTILDCPQVHPDFLQSVLGRATAHLGLPPPPPVDTLEMAARKAEEFATADLLIVPSEVCRRSFLQAGVEPEKLVEVPLWSDSSVWFPGASRQERKSEEPLRVLFVGSSDLRKGIPYLLDAARTCGPRIKLTLVGTRAAAMEAFLRRSSDFIQYLGTRSKPQIRELYEHTDVFVLPSLVDTFGFVAMEAMACGVPVIVSENCGVPVPDPSWRVPIMNSDAIAQRLLVYAEDPELCREHGRQALIFSRQFTLELYRRRTSELFLRLLR